MLILRGWIEDDHHNCSRLERYEELPAFPNSPSRPSPIPLFDVLLVEDLAEEMEVAVPKLTWKPNMHTLFIHKMEDKEDGKIETLPLPRQLVR